MIAAGLVASPNKIKMPETISQPPTKFPKNSGYGNPILANLPDPNSLENKNF
jgi:hypothetical protein